MPPLIATLASRLVPTGTRPRAGFLRFLPLVAIHLAALAIMLATEQGPLRMAIYLASWGVLNFLLIALLRRPAIAAALALAIFGALIWISRFKFNVLWMTANFTDLMIVDTSTIAFLWAVSPEVRLIVTGALALAVPLLVALWRIDPWRLRRRTAAAAAFGCAGTVVALALLFPLPMGQIFGNNNYVSVFMRTGVEGLYVLASQGYLDVEPAVAERLKLTGVEPCQVAGRPPHIILVHDESSFDIRAAKGIKVPPDYGGYFKSLDGRARTLLVEGAGGPSWFTEYNVLAGLSSRSFGRFQFFVTRIAAGRVHRGLPQSLRHCGYRTFAIYPALGSFLGARAFYRSVGVERFFDSRDIRGREAEPDRFYFDHAIRMFAQEHAKAPMFLHVYLTANHFPYDEAIWPEQTPKDWRDPGNEAPEINEYLRRQAMTERDYRDFLERLARDYPGEPFLIVRFGDHQPVLGRLLIDSDVDMAEVQRRIMAYDPRFYTTYYAIDAINFRPVNLAAALDPLDAAYLPLVVLEAAGLPLDPSFAEQKRILRRCGGLFYACGNGTEARRFNRLLIDAGLIKGF